MSMFDGLAIVILRVPKTKGVSIMTCLKNIVLSLVAVGLIGICLNAGSAPAAVAYSTDFDGDADTTPTGWTSTANLKLDGNGWYANSTGHSLSVYRPDTGLFRFVDGTLEADYQRGATFAGLVGRYQDSSNFYHVRVDGSNLEVYRFGLGGSGSLGGVAIPGYTSYPTDETWKLSATFLGSQINATLRDSSGTVVSSLSISDPGNELSGLAGVRGSDGAQWDSFTISNVNRLTFAVTTADGTGADAQIEKRDNGYDTNNYGTATSIQMKNADSGTQYLSRKSYLRFDLGAVDGLNAQDATLELTASSSPSTAYTFNVYGLFDGHTGENWTESGTGSITWNNAPGNDTTSLDGALVSETVLLGQIVTTGYSAGDVLQFTSQQLTDFLNADTDGQVTLILTRDTQSSNYSDHSNSFYSKEGSLNVAGDYSLAPTLLIYTVPEPSTFVLVLLGLASLTICRRRHAR